MRESNPAVPPGVISPVKFCGSEGWFWRGGGKEGGGSEQIRKTQDEPQWIVAQGLLSALTIPGFS